ncbi:MAG: hypothetical protein SVU69_07120 [Pseudomonadota bacterium]|nr:hypothetical protein [Pseudomonadota bacterium]
MNRFRIFLLVLALLTTGCSGTQVMIVPAIEIKGYIGSDHYDSIELLENEIWLKKGGTLVATRDGFESSIDDLKDGFAVASENGAKELTLSDSKYGFVVRLPDYSTIYIADKNNMTHWALISIQSELLDEYLSSLE